MTNQPAPPPRPEATGWQRWRAIVVTGGLLLPLVLVTALSGSMGYGFAAGPDHPGLATAFWVGSAAILGVAIAAPVGPGKRVRALLGAVLAVAWLFLLRFVLAP